MRGLPAAFVCALLLLLPTSARAQQIEFQKSLDTPAAVTLDAATARGKIRVRAGAPGHVVVRGTVTVRTTFNTPADALAIAKRLAANPPIERNGDEIRLRPPHDAAERRAVTIAYDVTVPAGTKVMAASDSGAISISGIAGAVSVRTQSSAITLEQLESEMQAASDSGAIEVVDVGGAATVTTGSSAITLRKMRDAVTVHTRSGAVDLEVSPGSDVDVETGSSAVAISGGASRLRARSRSGAISISGSPRRDWDINAESGHVELVVGAQTNARFDLSARSGTLRVPSEVTTTVVSKQHVAGTMGSGDATVTVLTGSGGAVVRIGGRTE